MSLNFCKKLAGIFFVLFLLAFLTRPTFAQENKAVNIYFFWVKGCPHCAREKIFLKSLQGKYENLEVKSFEIGSNQGNIQLLKKIGEKLQVDVSGLPFTVVGKYHFTGFLDEQTTGKSIEEAVLCHMRDGCPDLVADLLAPLTSPVLGGKTQAIPQKVNLPFIGTLETRNLSLPIFTIVIGLLDGFNPCAMWVLLFLISLLLGMKDRKKMWILGITFIITSGFVYFLFLSAWLNFFLFLGFVLWIRLIIGLVALGSGGYNLREYFINKQASCKVIAGERRKEVSERLEKITKEKKFILSLIGIIILAFGVNLVELVCSVGLPAIYTQVLSLSALPAWQYYLYLLLYIFIFMLDDMSVFVVAMITLKAVGMEGKYARFSHLVGGIIISLIGILLLLKPEVLMFG